MERLTERDDKGNLLFSGKQVYAGDFYEAASCLEEYEDTGLTPEQIMKLKERDTAMEINEIHVDEYYCPACGSENNCDQGVVEDIIRKHMNAGERFEFDFTNVKSFDCQCGRHYVNTGAENNDGWIPVDERLPEEKQSVLVQWEKYDRHLDVTLTYLDVMWLDDAEEGIFETINGVPNGKVIA